MLDAHERGEAAGDTLALFIVREIAETFEAEKTTADQLARAIQVLEKAHGEIGEVLSGLRRRLEREGGAMKTKPSTKVLARLRTEEKACRKEATRRTARAREFIGKGWYFLACTELIEAEVAHHERWRRRGQGGGAGG